MELNNWVILVIGILIGGGLGTLAMCLASTVKEVNKPYLGN